MRIPMIALWVILVGIAGVVLLNALFSPTIQINLIRGSFLVVLLGGLTIAGLVDDD